MKKLTVIFLLAAGLGLFQAVLRADDLERMEFGGRTRTYHMHTPGDLSKPVALVVVLHGALENAYAVEKHTQFTQKAMAENFIVVYPNGTGDEEGEQYDLMWNGGNCCGRTQARGTDDAGFIRAVVEKIKKSYSLDPNRIFVAGFSNGALLAYKLGCEASDLFAAIAPVSGSLEPACKPGQPVSVIAFHGTSDLKVLYDGGYSPVIDGSQYDTPVSFAMNFWSKQDRCGVPSREEPAPGWVLSRYAGCAGGTEVVFYTHQNGEHAWPTAEREGVSATGLIWKFFKAHPRKA